MGNVEFDDINLYKFAIQVKQIGNIGVKNAIEENRAKRIPSVCFSSILHTPL